MRSSRTGPRAHVLVEQCHVGAGRGQRAGHLAAQHTRAARDRDGLSREVVKAIGMSDGHDLLRQPRAAAEWWG